jgi:hypothetical protein
VFFEICGEIEDVETFAIGNSNSGASATAQILWPRPMAQTEGTREGEITQWYYSESRASLVRSDRHRQKRIQDQTLRGLAMPSRRAKSQDFAVCVKNAGFAASLEVRKLYAIVADPDAEANDLIRVVDESGDDYVYPARLFQRPALPGEVQRALRLAS